VEVPAATLDRLALIPQLPPSGGRHLSLPPGTFPDDDLERLRALGYEPGVFPSRPATAVERPPDGSRAGPRPGPTISVVLCTYQGARYLPEQLRSLTDQTLPPDEVVVCDDGSTDGTLGLLERFAEEVPFTVNVHRNPERLGSTKNFERGIELAKGELIFLCDQDDAWYPRKLEVMAGVLERDPVAGAAFSDADLMDERSRTRDSRLWETLGFTDEMRERLVERPVLVLSRGNVVTGAAMAFRAELRELVLPIPEGWVQDAWIGLLVGAVAGLAPIPEPLIRYRLHGGQQIGVPDPMSSAQHLRRRAQVVRRMTKQERPVLLEQSAYFEQALERLGERADRFPAPQDVLEELAAKIRHLRVRGEMREAGHRVRAVAGELAAGRYHRYSNGLASAAKDLLLADRLGRR
ncbi:MAG: glycosyltransferase family 2 protein, partial [Actinobacteria bacterium]|nr:glycosyltransferase family 2 protein [Actinomycetota bacterium]